MKMFQTTNHNDLYLTSALEAQLVTTLALRVNHQLEEEGSLKRNVLRKAQMGTWCQYLCQMTRDQEVDQPEVGNDVLVHLVVIVAKKNPKLPSLNPPLTLDERQEGHDAKVMVVDLDMEQVVTLTMEVSLVQHSIVRTQKLVRQRNEGGD